MMKPILTVLFGVLISTQLFAQIRDLDPTNTDRLLMEHRQDGTSVYRWCTLMATPEKKEIAPDGEKISYRGKQYNCPTRLGCRPDGTYNDAELVEYQSLLRLKRAGVITGDIVAVAILVVPTYLAAKGVAVSGAAVNVAKGVGLLTSVNVAGWTLSPYISKVTSRMDWTRFTRSIGAISTVWDVNPQGVQNPAERIGSIKEVRETLNKTLCELDEWRLVRQRGY